MGGQGEEDIERGDNGVGDMKIKEEQESTENGSNIGEISSKKIEEEERRKKIREKINRLRKENEESQMRIDSLRKEEENMKRIFREMAKKSPVLKEYLEKRKYI